MQQPNKTTSGATKEETFPFYKVSFNFHTLSDLIWPFKTHATYNKSNTICNLSLDIPEAIIGKRTTINSISCRSCLAALKNNK